MYYTSSSKKKSCDEIKNKENGSFLSVLLLLLLFVTVARSCILDGSDGCATVDIYSLLFFFSQGQKKDFTTHRQFGAAFYCLLCSYYT